MDINHFVHGYGIIGTTIIYSFLGGIFPLFNIEAYLLLISSTGDVSKMWPLFAFASAFSQMASKSLLFAAGRGVTNRIPKKYEAKVQSVLAKLTQWKYGNFLFITESAFIGLPPFYAVSIAAGVVKLDFVSFMCAGMFGRFFRFSACLLFPALCKSFLS